MPDPVSGPAGRSRRLRGYPESPPPRRALVEASNQAYGLGCSVVQCCKIGFQVSVSTGSERFPFNYREGGENEVKKLKASFFVPVCRRNLNTEFSYGIFALNPMAASELPHEARKVSELAKFGSFLGIF